MGECNRGKPLTPNGLAGRLKSFGIKPKTIRIGDKTPKGYEREAFADSFARYIPSLQTAIDANQTATGNPDVAVKNSHKPLKSRDVADVAVQTPLNGDARDFPAEKALTVMDGADAKIPASSSRVRI